MGNKFAVTTDGGMTWSVWDAVKNLPDCADIKDVQIEPSGDGIMQLLSFTKQKVPVLRSKDFGKSWGVN
jgi:hypothetical protein